MPSAPSSTCGRCRARGERVPIQGVVPDHPAGWTTITLRSTPVMNRVLCTACTAIVRALLNGAE